ncbi:ion transporter [Limnohabitans sp.]|uniref:ion transporter n=1 Tax=Limnohabitans sp. TaxID=1907725 RepID=UPI0033425891
MTEHAHPPKTSLLGLVYQWLFDPEFKHGFNHTVERCIAFLIVASVLAVLIENTPEIYNSYAGLFHWFDVLTVGIFTVEYVMRVATAHLHPDFAGKSMPRLRYAFSFYALVDLIAIAPFYFARFVDVDVEMLRVLRIMRLARMFKLSRQIIPAWLEFQELNQGRSFRAKVFALLEPTGHSGRLHAYLDNFIVFWVALSIFCVIFESVASMRALFAVEFHVIDVMAFTLFTIEYIARVYSAPENPKYHNRMARWAHIRSGPAIIDLLAILPFVLESLLSQHLDLRFLRVFRLVRMLKLTRYTSALETLYKVVQREWQVIFASVFVMMLLVVLTASLGFLLEHEAQPDKFENIPQSIYWAIITLASVGYGDISPITPMGRALTVVLALVGIGIFAIPAGLLASAFTDQLRIDRDAFKQRLMLAFEDGMLNGAERELIIAEAERLHLSHEEVTRLTHEARAEFAAKEAEDHTHANGLVLDAKAHPALAAAQFKLLVDQLSLIAQATGEDSLRKSLAHIKTDHQAELDVLAIVAKRHI